MPRRRMVRRSHAKLDRIIDSAVLYSAIQAIGSLGRDLCLVAGGAVMGFALTEGVRSNTFRNDLNLGIITVLASVGFGFFVNYTRREKRN